MNTLDYLVLSRVGAGAGAPAVGTGVDPVRLEIFNNLFMSVAEQMGYRLQSTAHSVNVKERLDFSCAIFDARATSSSTRRTCRCTSGRWARASRRSSPTARAR